jgi:hypothetical protein
MHLAMNPEHELGIVRIPCQSGMRLQRGVVLLGSEHGLLQRIPRLFQMEGTVLVAVASPLSVSFLKRAPTETRPGLSHSFSLGVGTCCHHLQAAR